MNQQGQTVCLSMIVKDEARVIERCLASLRPMIDHWIVVDTGSTDGTQEIIQSALRDLPGELIERPWVNFAHNRNEALGLARGCCDYIFVIDADEVVELADRFRMPKLEADAYQIDIAYKPYQYQRVQLIKDSLDCRYAGVLHECLEITGEHVEGRLPGLKIVATHDGARAHDPTTYARDALVLEKALLDEPTNSRYVFYLAQSYRDSGDYELALRNYKRRAQMNGWDEETWYSLYQIAQIKERISKSWADAREDYLAAYSFRPHRAGPLYRIGRHYAARGQFHAAHIFFAQAMRIPFPETDRLFVERDIYEYLLPMEYVASCATVGEHSAAVEVSNDLLRSGKLPVESVTAVMRSRWLSLDSLEREGAQQRVRVAICGDHERALERLRAQDVDVRDPIVIGARNPVDFADACVVNCSRKTAVDDRLSAVLDAGYSGDDVMVVLMAADPLAEPGAITQIISEFDRPECALINNPDLYAFRKSLWLRARPYLRNLSPRDALIRVAGEAHQLSHLTAAAV